MAKQRTEDALLKALYGSHYHGETEALCTKCELDRTTVMDGLKSLGKHGYVSQLDTNRFAITRLGIYYVERMRLVSGVQIEANEKLQLMVLDQADAKPPAEGEVAPHVPDPEDPALHQANLNLMISSGFLDKKPNGDIVITAEGLNHLKYLRSKYNVAPPPVLVAPKPVRRKVPVKAASKAVSKKAEEVAVGAG